MKITLKDIAESAEICEAAELSPEVEVLHKTLRSVAELKRDKHAREMLPAMHELVREMYELLRRSITMIESEGEAIDGDEFIRLDRDIRRLVERLEEEK